MVLKTSKECTLIGTVAVVAPRGGKDSPWWRAGFCFFKEGSGNTTLCLSGSFFCEDDDGDLCVKSSVSVFLLSVLFEDLSTQSLKNEEVQRKKKKSPKSYCPQLTITSFLVLFALLVFYPILYIFRQNIILRVLVCSLVFGHANKMCTFFLQIIYV